MERDLYREYNALAHFGTTAMCYRPMLMDVMVIAGCFDGLMCEREKDPSNKAA